MYELLRPSTWETPTCIVLANEWLNKLLVGMLLGPRVLCQGQEVEGVA